MAPQGDTQADGAIGVGAEPGIEVDLSHAARLEGTQDVAPTTTFRQPHPDRLAGTGDWSGGPWVEVGPVGQGPRPISIEIERMGSRSGSRRSHSRSRSGSRRSHSRSRSSSRGPRGSRSKSFRLRRGLAAAKRRSESHREGQEPEPGPGCPLPFARSDATTGDARDWPHDVLPVLSPVYRTNSRPGKLRFDQRFIRERQELRAGHTTRGRSYSGTRWGQS